MADRKYRIHPAVGIARVGDADRSGDDFFFIGPECPGIPANYDPATEKFGPFKQSGKIRPQAARFGIFEYERRPDGRFYPLGEVALGDGRTTAIEWRVHVANRKGSFCDFAGQRGAPDKPFFASYKDSQVRNRTIKGKSVRSAKLELDPGEKVIQGRATTPVELSFDHPGISLKSLGQLRSDAQGHLVFIGGTGHAAFDPDLPGHPRGGQPQPPGSLTGGYTNNDSWFDDVSDGPIEAKITIDGKDFDADGAWILVAPPKFAPAIRPYRTMYDTLVDLIVREIPIPADDGLYAGPLADIVAIKNALQAGHGLDALQLSFTRYVYPILSQVARIPRIHEPISSQVFHASLDPSGYDLLGGEDSDSTARGAVFRMIRDPASLEMIGTPPNFSLMPSAWGDYYDYDGPGPHTGGPTDPGYMHSVSAVQYAILKAWNSGNFKKDWTGVPQYSTNITPEGLDKAALENAIGGGFFPGIEASWLFARAVVYREPFRIARGKAVGTAPVPGEAQRRDVIVEAGAFSQQMALPWHADFFDCSKGEVPTNGGSRYVAWWPFQRPDDAYPIGTPNKRVPWARNPDGTPFGPTNEAGFEAMIAKWSTLGFVVETNGNLFEVDGPKPPLVA